MNNPSLVRTRPSVVVGIFIRFFFQSAQSIEIYCTASAAANRPTKGLGQAPFSTCAPLFPCILDRALGFVRAPPQEKTRKKKGKPRIFYKKKEDSARMVRVLPYACLGSAATLAAVLAQAQKKRKG